MPGVGVYSALDEVLCRKRQQKADINDELQQNLPEDSYTPRIEIEQIR